MRKLVLSVLGASALAIASAASAQTIITPGAPLPPNDPSTSFIVSGNIFSGPIAATIGHTGIDAGAFTDIFQFTIPQTGFGSGSITTSVSALDFLGETDLDIDSVVVNGLLAFTQLRTPSTVSDPFGVPCAVRGVDGCGANEVAFRNDVPILAGVLNTITVNGLSRGNGSYGGNLTFTPTAVPEPATWGMMLLGFAGIGWQLRRKRNTGAIAQLA